MFQRHLPKKLRLALLVGGGNTKEQMETMSAGVDIVTATPGRLQDLLHNGYVTLEFCRFVSAIFLHIIKFNMISLIVISELFSFFIVDEIDSLLTQGNNELILELHRGIPKMTDDGDRLQMIVCSATLHNFDVKKLANKIMYFPTWVDLKVPYYF